MLIVMLLFIRPITKSSATATTVLIGGHYAVQGHSQSQTPPSKDVCDDFLSDHISRIFPGNFCEYRYKFL